MCLWLCMCVCGFVYKRMHINTRTHRVRLLSNGKWLIPVMIKLHFLSMTFIRHLHVLINLHKLQDKCLLVKVVLIATLILDFHLPS